jgi:hypothetical protein
VSRWRQLLVVPPPARLLQWLELDRYSFQSPLPPCPRSHHPFGPRGRTEEYPATTQLSAYSTKWKVLDYTTRGTHLLAGRFGYLQLLGGAFPRHIARPRRRRGNASFQVKDRLGDQSGGE